MAVPNILIYLLRHDLRIADNPVLHHLATTAEHGFTHVLPVYVFPAHQIEISGFLRENAKSPYPEARSQIGKFWRCGHHRTKFVAESVWNLKESLEKVGSGLALRAGRFGDVAEDLLQGFADKQQKVGAIWMTSEEAIEEKKDEEDVSTACKKHGVAFKTWLDEKYFIDDRDLHFKSPDELADVFTAFRKTQEPLREKPRPTLPPPSKGSLPPYPDQDTLPPQRSPFDIPSTFDALESALLKPLTSPFSDEPEFPENAQSVHPFQGGEGVALQRLDHLVKTGAMSSYKDTRNGLLGVDFSTKLSAYLSFGCLTSRQIHEAMVRFEDGQDDKFKGTPGYGKGENDGTKAVRFELLWRDYMRLCTRKFQEKLFRVTGFKGDTTPKWKSADPEHVVSDDNMGTSVKKIQQILQRFLNGTTGMGLIDASQRELWHTGYTSNRARQNVASFLTKHLGIDWRYGAEWYEYLLVDYDVSSNWSNWQYVAGVGNDPRGDNRIFNPVKQAFDYDKSGEYVKAWVVETREIEKLENVFQLWTTPQEELERLGLSDSILVTDPIKKIEFSVEGKPKTGRRQYNNRKRGRGNSNHNGTGGGGPRGPPSASGGPFGGLSGGPSGGFGPQNGVASDQGSTSHSSSRSPPNGPQGYRTNSGYRGDFRGGYRGGRGGRGGGYRGGRGSFSGRGGGFNNSHYAPNMPPNGHPNGQPRPQWTTTASGPIM
ncbi:DASH family cryptochrome [Colletotrichum higginsianum]|uniref:Cryptochrome DASH n=1 Tax=Colletotrichum higginsianum (strain IMI 349063) TaxID=759273 RepID=H1W0T8_COLHI|nr:DASH family cryptochrome [Colletotrichum higginsianum IMI 349063]OBR08699.1 DASH family cryptochrome [Colletotrichum higginsianum IMI 349063]CCF46101.1 DASH family cryptochrome [Colletotrichum higginsianum]